MYVYAMLNNRCKRSHIYITKFGEPKELAQPVVANFVGHLATSMPTKAQFKSPLG